MWNEVNFIELANVLSLGENEFIDMREHIWAMDEKEVNQFNDGVLKYKKEFWRSEGGEQRVSSFRFSR